MKLQKAAASSDPCEHKPQLETATERMAHGKTVRNTILLRLPDNEFEAIQPHLRFTNLNLANRCSAARSNRFCVFHESRHRIHAGRDRRRSQRRSRSIGPRRHDRPPAGGSVLKAIPTNIIVQVPGDGFQVDSTVMRRAICALPELRRILVRQLGIRSVQFAQNAACNRCQRAAAPRALAAGHARSHRLESHHHHA